ncbi:hypothetical protein [Algicella marina]|uniref:Uncharacterized protein n=1 Tax=Algicella marina TaxID=2683284 RepID=A0A6P1SV97_9RHOB|nr:hypothetical protein [Algicella marina]QHQ34614.1 hypothetical protein GO499_05120 [Algicella marina]
MSDERHSVWQWRPGSPHGVAEERPEVKARAKASPSMRKDIKLIAVLLVVMLVSYGVAQFASGDGMSETYRPVAWGAGVLSAMSFGALLLKVAEKLVDPSIRIGHVLLVSAVALGLLTFAYLKWVGASGGV